MSALQAGRRRVPRQALCLGLPSLQRRSHGTVCPGLQEGARGDDGEGMREVHLNTLEGLGPAVRNFLRPVRGVHKKSLKYYLAICEHRLNPKRISPVFIAGLVTAHKTQT